MPMLIAAIGAVVFIGMLYAGRGFWAWVGLAVACLLAWGAASDPGPVFIAVAAVLAAIALLFGVPPLRRAVVSGPLLGLVGKALPTIGDTERIALEAGTVWWDGDLFSGDPDWQKLLDFQPQPLSESERAFLDGPVEDFCAMIDDWQIAQDRDLAPGAWEFLKRERFFGLTIPEEYGGRGYSAIAHSAVVTKISSRSLAAAVIVMVPNSLGPGELLLHYGTDAQKKHYLPRLASGEDIPCFALTEPEAGSDAAAARSSGIVCRDVYEGKEVLGLRLNWAKRYITLAPVADVIGLAFRAIDPDGLLGGEEDLGITCALIPPGLPGIDVGRHHDPMGIPFPNGPIFGVDVFVPMDAVIGGRDGIGQGWRMLMESLAEGRSISLPSLSVGAAQLAARATGAYGTVREQFNMPIGRFEGIEEPLARTAAGAYTMNAARILTCGGVDAGEKPAVLSAIVKAYLTDNMRAIVNDAMDVLAGAAICRGPRNIVGRGYVGIPIGITVEGANILTRSLIIYGQGAIRSHPFVRDEMEAVQTGDLVRFDKAFFGHVNFVCRNAVRALFLGLTGGRLAAVPVGGAEARYYRQLTRFSSAFALVSDTALATLGGTLKRREKISGRMADALAWMYLGSAALKRFHDESRPERDRDLLQWSLDNALWRVQEALGGVIDNLPNRAAAHVLKPLVFPTGRSLRPPDDDLGARVAGGLLEDAEQRLALTADIYIPAAGEPGLGRLEEALDKAVQVRPIRDKLRRAVRDGTLAKELDEALAETALDQGVIDEGERRSLKEFDEIRTDVIQVDVFEAEEYRSLKG